MYLVLIKQITEHRKLSSQNPLHNKEFSQNVFRHLLKDR